MAKRRSASTTPTNAEPRRAPEEIWPLFQKEFPEFQPEADQVIYALPVRLIEELRTHASAFFTAKMAKFERRLRQVAVTGFANSLPFYAPVLDRPCVGTCEFPDSAVMNVSRGMYRESAEMITGYSHTLPETILETAANDEGRGMVSKPGLELLKNYVGWLITHREFHLELADFRRTYPDYASGSTVATYHRREGEDLVRSGDPSNFSESLRSFQKILKRWSLSAVPALEFPWSP